MPSIQFARRNNNLVFVGRNGVGICTGVDLMEAPYYDGDTRRTRIIVSPVTSRGTVGRCSIDIPVEDLRAVGQALLELADKMKGS
jgi:CBS domain-containing protein